MRHWVALVLVFAGFGTVAACGSSTKQNGPGGPCMTISDCTTPSPYGDDSCAWGFCTTGCMSDSDCQNDPAAAGPTCHTCFNGSQICCPASGCENDPNSGNVCGG
jgi:hypothetical protein